MLQSAVFRRKLKFFDLTRVVVYCNVMHSLLYIRCDGYSLSWNVILAGVGGCFVIFSVVRCCWSVLYFEYR